MVSDYKFHLFSKHLKKEKWRPNGDLSMPGMRIFHYFCVAAASQEKHRRAFSGLGDSSCCPSRALGVQASVNENIPIRFSQVRNSGQIPSGREC